jgi:hypothetical protein
VLGWKAHKGQLGMLAFSPDGRLIATNSGTRVVSLWDATSGKLVCKLGPHVASAACAVAFFPDGKHAAVFHGDDGGGCIWEVGTGKLVARLAAAHSYPQYTVAVRPDGKQLLHATPRGFVVWDDPARASELPRTHDRLWGSGFFAWPSWIGYSPAGTYLWRVSSTVCLYDPDTESTLREISVAGCHALTPVAFSADESRMVVGFDRRVFVWRLDEPKAEPVELTGHRRRHARPVGGVGFLPNGQVLTAGMDGTTRLWNADTGAQVRSFDWGIGKVLVAAVSPDGLTCAAGGEKGQVVVWDVDA